MIHFLKTSLILLTTLTLGACSTQKPTDLSKDVWHFPGNHSKATLQFNNETQISGFSACNVFQGTIEKDHQRYRFVNDLAMSMKLCGKQDNQTEAKVLEWLSKTAYFVIEKDALVLYDQENKPLTRLIKEKIN